MKKRFSLILIVLIIISLVGCDYYPWMGSTGTTTSNKLILGPAIGATKIDLLLAEEVSVVNYGESYFNGGPTFNSNKGLNQIKSEITYSNSNFIVSNINMNTLLLEVPNDSININHFYVITFTEYNGGKTYYVIESRARFVMTESYGFILFPIYLLTGSMPLHSWENNFKEDHEYSLLNSTIDDFINYYETINAFNFTHTKNSIVISGVNNSNTTKLNELITSFTLTFTDGKVSIDV